ncbi:MULTISPECIES: hypothetical protein [Citrobacter]|uniref:hypothetical protein n=1 Tax=Citrobacter TaxID=544 RepID=UPI001903D891|nr:MULTISPECIES: hypothetical protein [Citrobacter]MBJ8997835.1 hypothetical protein [Citrobacter braakii]MDM3453724.1 hypothetical protein [Citrobacter sp. Cb028]
MADKININSKDQNVRAKTGERHQAVVQGSLMEILIGGPYVKDGEDKTYGHVAIRIIALKKDYTYDYGRYGATRGVFNDEGDGIIRVWSSFKKYIAGENATGRKTVGYMFSIKDEDAKKVIEYYDEFVKGAGVVAKSKVMTSYKTKYEYDALKRNCTTVSFDGAKIAISEIDNSQAKYNNGQGLSMKEKLAAKVSGWPDRVFMPADAGVMLKSRDKPKPVKINQYGN